MRTSARRPASMHRSVVLCFVGRIDIGAHDSEAQPLVVVVQRGQFELVERGEGRTDDALQVAVQPVTPPRTRPSCFSAYSRGWSTPCAPARGRPASLITFDDAGQALAEGRGGQVLEHLILRGLRECTTRRAVATSIRPCRRAAATGTTVASDVTQTWSISATSLRLRGAFRWPRRDIRLGGTLILTQLASHGCCQVFVRFDSHRIVPQRAPLTECRCGSGRRHSAPGDALETVIRKACAEPP